jgi:EAL domain-containing protein (putative c-di-GMP-specific phosphodiesterase class I)
VLVALGDHPQREDCCALLRQQGFEVVAAESGEGALREILAREVDVILGSAQLPDLHGLTLLARVRAVDPDVSVILVSAGRDLDNAVEAMELGALRYLTRAVTNDELVALVGQGARLRRNARRRYDSMTVIRSVGPTGRAFGDAASLADAFESALRGVYLSFQPIVSCVGRAPVAYEALMRCREPRLPSPLAMLEAAEKLGRLEELGRRIRVLAAEAVVSLPPEARLFVNVHPRDLEDADLYDPEAPLTQQAHRVTIEVTERARLEDEKTTQVYLRRLRALGYRVAIDDLGAGYAGLASVAVLHPEIVKVDMSLVRGVDRNPISARIIRALAAVCAEMGISLVAEGVETRAERDTLVGLGCDLLQGYLFARPGPEFAEPASDLYPG